MLKKSIHYIRFGRKFAYSKSGQSIFMNLFEQQNTEFQRRHIGSQADTAKMLSTIGVSSMEELVNKTIPDVCNTL